MTEQNRPPPLVLLDAVLVTDTAWDSLSGPSLLLAQSPQQLLAQVGGVVPGTAVAQGALRSSWQAAGRPGRVLVVAAGPTLLARGAELARLALGGEEVSVVPVGVRSDHDSVVALEQAGAWFVVGELADALALARAPRFPVALTLVLLAYNEERAVADAVREADRFGRLFCEAHEVVVVDDGSTDGTRQQVEGLGLAGVKLVRHAHNRGMGAALRSGYRAAAHEYVVHLPADRQVRPTVLLELLPLVDPHRVALTFYREAASGNARRWVSWSFRLLLRHVGGLRVDFAGTFVFHRRWIEGLVRMPGASDSFVYTYQVLQHLVAQGCRPWPCRVHCFRRDTGQSRVFGLRRIGWVARELARHRLHTALSRLGRAGGGAR